MCVIIHKVDTLDENTIVDCFTSNPDGFGLMYQENNRVVTHKGLYEIDYIIDLLHKFRDREYVAHFRIATVGNINNDNCHPFYCGGSTYLMHNGTLDINIYKKKMSDTWHFAQLMRAAKVTNNLLDHLPKIVGDNKLVFMNKKSTRLVGRFEEYEGNYFSNLRWLDYKLYDKDFYSSYAYLDNYAYDEEDVEVLKYYGYDPSDSYYKDKWNYR